MSIGSQMKKILKELGIDQYYAAAKLGVSQPRLNQWLNDRREPDVDAIQNFCKNFHTTPNILYEKEEFNKIDIKTIYKVGYVQAGKFNEACQLPESEWEEIPYPVNENYKKAHIFALGVRGDSMNLTFPPEKTTLICCPLEDWMGANPEADIEGKYIIAYRHSPDGLCEATVKKYTKIDDSTIILVAESNNPEIKPIVLHPDSNEYEIAAVVIGDMRIY